MNTLISRLLVLCVSLLLATASHSEARIGGGSGSSGYRGSRSFGTRSYQTAPTRPNYTAPQQQPRQQPMQQPMLPQGGYAQPAMGGGFMRGMMGGIAGGFLGSMLFRGMGYGGMGGYGGGGGGGGVGLLEILLLAGLGFWIFRTFVGRNAATQGGYAEVSPYERLRAVEPGPFATAAPVESEPDLEATAERDLRQMDPSFNLASFKEERMDEFLKLQAAWNYRDLSSVANLIGPELRQKLDADIAKLKSQGQINKIENIAVRSAQLFEAWEERGQQFATIRFKANVTDYTVNEATGELVAGSRTEPVKFEEDWTFTRGRTWMLSAIEA